MPKNEVGMAVIEKDAPWPEKFKFKSGSTNWQELDMIELKREKHSY